MGERGVKLGLFYDTSTLQNGVRGAEPPEERADLTTPAGKDLFCNTIIEYFERIPPALWGRVEGRPLVVLYAAGFASKWNADLGDELATRFEARFPGERPFLVADASWGEIGQDRTTSWGARCGVRSCSRAWRRSAPGTTTRRCPAGPRPSATARTATSIATVGGRQSAHRAGASAPGDLE